MQRHLAGMPRPRDPDGRPRVLIIDQHEIYRCACAALLRTEGLHVVEAAPADDIFGLARALEPDVVLIDAAPPPERLRHTVRQLKSLPSAPTVVFISSAGPDELDSCVARGLFISKGDVCARELVRAFLDDSGNPDTPAR